jgi:hypothetical protein
MKILRNVLETIDIDDFAVKPVGECAVGSRIDVVGNAVDRTIAKHHLESRWVRAAKPPWLGARRVEIRSVLRRLGNGLWG